ncbi:unnamed protein product [Clonostachys rosea]|uniref:2EXR domain-containing protein n=1 Tax=Bionectria ochroleuca TaxID=29856 RepID=A0ABY6U310_BIOOC|nr:unnamed protein product [Clonostachys rosea]
MASFHLFPDLPYEIRLQIWQQAIRPSTKRCSGIQHFSILCGNVQSSNTTSKPEVIPSSRGTPTPRDKQTIYAAIPRVDAAAQANRSAYMWDAGLWTACWESRQIILRHWEMKKWSEKRQSFLSEGVWLWYGEEIWRENQGFCITINAPSLNTNDGGEDWQLMVRPYEDAFYFDPKSLMDVLHLPNQPGHGYTLYHIMQQLPFSGLNYGCQPVRHLIFDFDPNWVNNLPRYHAHLDRDSPPALIIELLWTLVRSKTEFHIWLIDRSLRQSSIKNKDGVPSADVIDKDRRVFYNCDEEFVDLGKAGYERFDQPWMHEYDDEDFVISTEFLKCDEKKLSAALAREENGFAGWFVWWLAKNLNEDLSELKSYPWQLDDPTYEYFGVEEHISILGYRS